MSGEKGDHTDDQDEMDGLGPAVADFLPPPERPVLRDDKVKVTLSPSRRSVEFFKREAERRHVPYQRMIRALVDEYAERHG
jgi:predicted DNA binding CopG/RHH family protein